MSASIPTGVDAARLVGAEGKCDLVCANYVFANVEHLDGIVSGIEQLLSDDGIFMFETQYGVDVIDRFRIHTIYHEHISYFNIRPLEILFARHGMTLFDVVRIATKGGSIRVFVKKAAGRHPIEPVVRAMIEDETRRGFDRPAGYKAFAARFYSIPVEQVSKDQRQFAKMMQLALGFGMGWRKFQVQAKSQGYDLSDDEASEAVNRWRDIYADIAAGWRACDLALENIADNRSEEHTSELQSH